MTLLRRMTGRPTKDGSGEKTNAVMCTWGIGEGGDRGSGPQMHARSLPYRVFAVVVPQASSPALYTVASQSPITLKSGSNHSQGRALCGLGSF